MKTISLAFWSVISGIIRDVQEFDEHIIAQIGEIPVIFPIELGQKLRSLIGVRVAILHTNIAGKEYLFHVLPEEKPDNEMDSAASAYQAAAATEMTTAHTIGEGIV